MGVDQRVTACCLGLASLFVGCAPTGASVRGALGYRPLNTERAALACSPRECNWYLRLRWHDRSSSDDDQFATELRFSSGTDTEIELSLKGTVLLVDYRSFRWVRECALSGTVRRDPRGDRWKVRLTALMPNLGSVVLLDETIKFEAGPLPIPLDAFERAAKADCADARIVDPLTGDPN